MDQDNEVMMDAWEKTGHREAEDHRVHAVKVEMTVVRVPRGRQGPLVHRVKVVRLQHGGQTLEAGSVDPKDQIHCWEMTLMLGRKCLEAERAMTKTRMHSRH